MNYDEVNKLWYELKPIEGLMFKYNDYIKIKAGEYAGQFASVISLLSIEPITYLVETDSFGDVSVKETEIEIVE